MTVMHPEFDPVTRTWFVGQHEALTLRELGQKIGGEVKFADYYPNGFTDTLRLRVLPVVEKEPAPPEVPKKPTVKPPPRRFTEGFYHAEPGGTNKFRDDIINMVNAKATYVEAALAFNVTKATVAGIMRRYRRKLRKAEQVNELA